MKRGTLDHALWLAFVAGWRAHRRSKYTPKPYSNPDPQTAPMAYDAWRAEVYGYGLHDTSDAVSPV
jgi:hypothetical protein